MKQNDNIPLLEERINYRFKDKGLARQSITHSSFANEMKINNYSDYERLEFLGDAVLEMVSSEFIFKEYIDMSEGDMTKLRASLVCEPALAYCARKFDLDSLILLGKGEEATGGRKRDSIASDVCEAVIGAIYLDGGIDRARDFIHKYILSHHKDICLFKDSKTCLQEIIQARGIKDFEYRQVAQLGPEHRKEFVMELVLEGEVVGTGRGFSKKSAQQEAARSAISKLIKD